MHVVGDVLEGTAPEDESLVKRRWTRLSTWQRRFIVGAGVALASLAGIVVLLDRYEERRAELAMADQVLLQVSLEVSSSSSSPPGGRVDYFLSVRNQGARTVYLIAVSFAAARFEATSRSTGETALRSGGEIFVPLSVALDCARPDPPAQGAAVSALVSAVAASGRTQRVRVPLARASLLTDVATTLCGVVPSFAGEMSGPVVRRAALG